MLGAVAQGQGAGAASCPGLGSDRGSPVGRGLQLSYRHGITSMSSHRRLLTLEKTFECKC